MSKPPKIIIITGAESTGKSTLAESLGQYFNVPVIPEFAREYVEQLNRAYKYSDVEIIARKQVEQLHAAKKQNHPVIFVDTWLIISKVWFEMVFERVPTWMENEIQTSQIDLFLVCDIDLPWIPDSVRENGGKKRRILQNMYIDNIKKYNFTY
ncbi:MAG TPA: ATP-binding protein, partial [Draconibacterium sp.]|nr:ATP-binding protein [Draconibacterium sp.]